MLEPQVIVTQFADTDNHQVSATRLNVNTVIFRARTSNTDALRIGFSAVSTTPPEPPTFTVPTDPLTSSTQNTIQLEPGEELPWPPISWFVERGERIDLQRVYAQGTINDVLETIYEVRTDA